MSAPLHEPVMVAETVTLLAPSRGGLFVDCTVGLGGHTRALLEAGASRILGLDRDPEALRIAAESLAGFGDRVELGARGLSRPGARARRAWRSRHRRSAGGSGCVLDAARRRRPRLQLPARGSAGHADGPLAGTDSSRLDCDHGRGVARERDLPVRRRTLLATDRTGHRRPRGSSSRSGPRRRWRRSSAGRSRGEGTSASIPRRARSRRCGSGSIASSKASSAFCRRPPIVWSVARGWR